MHGIVVFVLQSLGCVDSCDPTNYSSPVPSVHEFSQARILEWVAILYHWATGEAYTCNRKLYKVTSIFEKEMNFQNEKIYKNQNNSNNGCIGCGLETSEEKISELEEIVYIL